MSFSYTNRGNSAIVIVILIALIIGIGVLWYSMDRPSQTGGTDTNQVATDTAQQVGTGETIKVTYTDEGFVPPRVVIDQGDTIELVNRSNGTLTPAAAANAPDRFAQKAPDLSFGESYSYTTREAGEWSYTNAAAEAHSGEVRVK